MLSHAKITDFGLARELTNTMSVAASMVGTVPYICPEIIENKAYRCAVHISHGLIATGMTPPSG